MRTRVLVLADVPGWAWDRKAQAYAHHLQDDPELIIEVGYHARSAYAFDQYDLIHSFEVKQLDVIPPSYPGVLLSGLTAHVWSTWGETKMREWAQRCDGLHGNSRLLVKELAQFHPVVYYTPNGVDTDYWHRFEPRTSTTVVPCHIGKPNPRKGGDLIKEACRRADLLPLMVQRTQGIRLSWEEIRLIYQQATIQITMSDMDGTPNPMLESAACENALVSTRIGNMPEVIVDGKNGALVDRTVDDLTRTLIDLKRWPDGMIAMGRAARRTMLDEWTWATQVPKVRAVWIDALTRKRARKESVPVSKA